MEISVQPIWLTSHPISDTPPCIRKLSSRHLFEFSFFILDLSLSLLYPSLSPSSLFLSFFLSFYLFLLPLHPAFLSHIHILFLCDILASILLIQIVPCQFLLCMMTLELSKKSNSVCATMFCYCGVYTDCLIKKSISNFPPLCIAAVSIRIYSAGRKQPEAMLSVTSLEESFAQPFFLLFLAN